MKRIITRNILWNLAARAVELGIAFFLARFLVHRLGDTTYGLWIIIGSLMGYFGMLDFGLQASVGRQLAFHHAREDTGRINAAVSTAVAVLLVSLLIALAGIFVILAIFFHLFAVPPDQVVAVQWTLVFAGVNLALMLIARVFDAALWAYQRFDILGGIEIVAALGRAALTFTLISRGGGLIALGLLTLIVTLAVGGAKMVATFWVEPRLSVRPRHVTRAALRELFGYSFWYFLASTARMITPRLTPAVIGNQLAINLVTPYSVSTRLVEWAAQFNDAGAGVLTPVSASMNALDRHGGQQRVFLEGGKYCLASAGLFLGLFTFLGRPFLTLWMGPEFGPAALLLFIVALGETLPLSQSASNSVILGTARHRVLAGLGFLDTLSAVLLMVLLVRPYGLVGVCIGVAVPAFVFRGILPWLYAGRLVHVGIGQYARQTLLPVLGAAVVPIGLLGLMAAWWLPSTWPELVLVSGAFTGGYFLSCLVWLAPPGIWKRLLSGFAAFRTEEAAPVPANPVAAADD